MGNYDKEIGGNPTNVYLEYINMFKYLYLIGKFPTLAK